MKRICILFILIITTFNYCLSQISHNFGPELGFAISRFPDSYNTKTANDDANTKIYPLISPLIGIHAQFIVRKKFLFTTGLQYEIGGKRYRYNNNGYDTINHGNFTVDVRENQSFHKICLPLSLGVTFDFLKIHLSVYGGWRPNYFISGKYYNNTILDHSINSEDDHTEIEFNPIHKNECYKSVKHFNNQLYCGISVSKKRFEVAMNCNIGANISYSLLPEYQIKNYYEFKNNDYTLSLRYRFFSFSNQKVHCNLFALHKV